ncbi:MAG TPA: S1C family serine protease [bacterium]|nr:S1C family serine protease [bacterium]
MDNKPFLVILAIGVVLSSVAATYLFNSYVYPLRDQLRDAGVVLQIDDSGNQAGVLVTQDGSTVKEEKTEAPNPLISLENNSPYRFYSEQIKTILPQLRRGMVALAVNDKNTGELTVKGYGLVLSNDGWLITWPDLMSANTLILDDAGNSLTMETYKDDPATGLRFVKVKTDNLYVLKLASQDAVNEGEFLLSIDMLRNVRIGNLVNLNYLADKAQSLSSVKKRYALDFTGNELKRGLPIFNLEAEVIGLVEKNEAGQVIVLPIYYAYNNLDEIFADQVSVLNLPIEYLDLAFQLRPLANMSKGAYLTKAAIVSGVDNQKITLYQGDVITKVDNQELNNRYGLADVLSQYAGGQKIVLEIVRGGQTINETIVLQKK